MLNQAIAGILNEVEYMVKAIRSTVIGVRNHGAIVLDTEFGQSPDLGLILRWTFFLHQCKVVPVHYQNQIMSPKVLFVDLARPEA